MLLREKPDLSLGTGDIATENLEIVFERFEIVSEHGDIVVENRPLVRNFVACAVDDAAFGST